MTTLVSSDLVYDTANKCYILIVKLVGETHKIKLESTTFGEAELEAENVIDHICLQYGARGA